MLEGGKIGKRSYSPIFKHLNFQDRFISGHRRYFQLDEEEDYQCKFSFLLLWLHIFIENVPCSAEHSLHTKIPEIFRIVPLGKQGKIK